MNNQHKLTEVEQAVFDNFCKDKGISPQCIQKCLKDSKELDDTDIQAALDNLLAYELITIEQLLIVFLRIASEAIDHAAWLANLAIDAEGIVGDTLADSEYAANDATKSAYKAQQLLLKRNKVEIFDDLSKKEQVIYNAIDIIIDTTKAAAANVWSAFTVQGYTDRFSDLSGVIGRAIVNAATTTDIALLATNRAVKRIENLLKLNDTVYPKCVNCESENTVAHISNMPLEITWECSDCGLLFNAAWLANLCDNE